MLAKTLKFRLVSSEDLLSDHEGLEGRVFFAFKLLIILKELLDSSGGKGLYVVGATGLYVLGATRRVLGYYIL